MPTIAGVVMAKTVLLAVVVASVFGAVALWMLRYEAVPVSGDVSLVVVNDRLLHKVYWCTFGGNACQQLFPPAEFQPRREATVTPAPAAVTNPTISDAVFRAALDAAIAEIEAERAANRE